MSIKNKLMEKAEERRREAVQSFGRRREQEILRLRSLHPRLEELAGLRQELGSSLIAAALEGNTDRILKIRTVSEGYAREEAALLASLGEQPDALKEGYYCPLCEDEGQRNGTPCSCRLSFFAQAMEEEYAVFLREYTLNRLHLDLYSQVEEPKTRISPRMSAGFALKQCADYAAGFAPGVSTPGGTCGLYILGPSGTGKTVFAAATAREILHRGFFVYCASAIELFAAYDRSRYGRESEEEREMLVAATDCDLLVLDDLGEEASPGQHAPYLNQLLSTRLANRQGLIVATALSPEDLMRSYSPSVSSRIAGSLLKVSLFGEDLRLKDRNPG